MPPQFQDFTPLPQILNSAQKGRYGPRNRARSAYASAHAKPWNSHEGLREQILPGLALSWKGEHCGVKPGYHKVEQIKKSSDRQWRNSQLRSFA